MKQPEQYELKKWLCEHCIVGLRLYFYQTGTDTSSTDWELTPTSGKPKRVESSIVAGLVDLSPDWVRVLRVKDAIIEEIDGYQAFAKKEAKDLAEFKRLKKKFS